MQWSEIISIDDTTKATCLVQTRDGGYALGGITGNFEDIMLTRTSSEDGLIWTGSTPNTITVYKGRNDPYWNYVRVCIWKIRAS